MTRFVIDAPTLVHLVSEGVHVSPNHQLVAPSSIRSQALSLLYALVRSGDLTERVALQHHERITELKIRVLGDRVSRRVAWSIARKQKWETTFDAEYVGLVHLQADALVTVDAAMAEKAKALVPIAPFEALAEHRSWVVPDRLGTTGSA
jgi:predicted nucleic acid-binding protein